jgi:hypothetical protein
MVVGAKVEYHPVIGGPSDGKVYTIRELGWRDGAGPVAWVEERLGCVSLRALSLHEQTPIAGMLSGYEGLVNRIKALAVEVHEWRGLLKAKDARIQALGAENKRLREVVERIYDGYQILRQYPDDASRTVAYESKWGKGEVDNDWEELCRRALDGEETTRTGGKECPR